MSFTIDYKDKVVLVTGVSSGIGLGTACQFARAGAHVAGCSRKASGDKEAVAFRKAVEDAGVQAFYKQTDVTRPEELEELVEGTIRTFGRLDILVSSAGVNVFEGAEGCTEERWQYNLDLNLAAHWRLAKLCKPYLEQSGAGVILLMTSNHAFGTIPGCFPYSVTKTAITGLVRNLAIEWGPAIRTVGVAPGFIDTDMTSVLPENAKNAMLSTIPMGHPGAPEDVAQAVAFFARPESAYIYASTWLLLWLILSAAQQS